MTRTLKRLFRAATCLCLLSGPLGLPPSGCAQAPHPASRPATVLRHLSIYQARGEYCAWPSIARAKNGDLLLLFTRSEEHLGPDGAILQCRSTDNGVSWLPPVVILDSPIDDRESGITPLRDGRILGHFWSTFHTPRSYRALPPDSYAPDLLARWIRYVESPEYLDAQTEHGSRSSVTADDGRTWSPLLPGHDAVHGGIELARGGVLLASYRESPDGIAVWRADSALGPWTRLASLHSPRPDSLAFGEPHILELPSGRVIMMIRATAKPYDDMDPRCVLWESYSDDGGSTWITPFETPLWGFPPHCLLLADGRILCSYGYRRPPFGERACISADGVTWRIEDEVIIRDDAPNGDCGYPASIELEPGIVLTVYYQPDVPRGTTQQMKPPDQGRTRPGILGTVWRVPPPK